MEGSIIPSAQEREVLPELQGMWIRRSLKLHVNRSRGWQQQAEGWLWREGLIVSRLRAGLRPTLLLAGSQWDPQQEATGMPRVCLCLGYLQLLFSGSTSKEIIFPTCIMWVFLESSDGYCLKSWVQGTPTTLASEPMVHSANYQTLRDWYIISFTVTPFSVLVTMCHGCNTYSVERADFHF